MSVGTPGAAAAASTTDDQGAAGAAGTPSPADAAAAAAATAAAAPAAPAGDDQEAAGGAAGDNDSPWADPEKAKREIDRLRREAGDQRINAKKTAAEEARTELLATLQAALDPNAKKGAPALTAEQLTEKLAASTTENVNAARAAGVVAAAWQANLNPAKLDYLQFQLGKNAAYQKLDPAAADFATKLSAVITAEVTKDPSFKLSGAAVASGVEQHGGTGGATGMTKTQFDKMPYTERLALYTTNRAEYDRLNSER